MLFCVFASSGSEPDPDPDPDPLVAGAAFGGTGAAAADEKFGNNAAAPGNGIIRPGNKGVGKFVAPLVAIEFGGIPTPPFFAA